MEDGDYEKAHIGTHTHNSYSEKERKDILEADLTYSDAKLDEMGAEKLATEMKRETEEKRAAFKRRAEKMIKRADALAKMTPEEATAAEKIAKALSPRKRARSAPASAAKPTGPTRSAGRSATPELRDRGGDVSSGDEAEETGPSSAGAKKPYKAWKEDENKFVIEARNEKPPMSYEEIAKELGRKAGAVRKHHSDLMKKA
jgi:predicted HTH transcriptional regulator